MKIEATNIYVMLTIFFATMPRFFYFLIVNKRRYPDTLFRGKYLLFEILAISSATGALVFALLFSNNFFYVGIFLSWAAISGILLCLYFTLWVLFWMHGYEARYQFNKVIVPAPMSIISSMIIFLSGLMTLNYYVIGFSISYGLFSYLWNYQGYRLTKPFIPDDMPIREPED